MNKEMNKEQMGIFYWFLKTLLKGLLIVLILIIIGHFIIKWYPGSNADIPTYPDATIICVNHYLNETATYQYSYLDEQNAKDAYDFAVQNNCSFQHSRFELNISGGIK